MTLAFLALHIIVYILCIIAWKSGVYAVDTYTQSQERWSIRTCKLFIVLFLCYEVLSYFCDISLKGSYTDFIIGLIIFIYIDIKLIVVYNKSDFARYYKKLRQLYIFYNTGRLLVYLYFFFGAYITVSVTHPKRNMERTLDVELFPGIYGNGTSYPVLKNGWSKKCSFILSSDFLYIFRRKLLETNDCTSGSFSKDDLIRFGHDSLYANNLGLFIVREDDKIVFGDQIIKLNP